MPLASLSTQWGSAGSVDSFAVAKRRHEQRVLDGEEDEAACERVFTSGLRTAVPSMKANPRDLPVGATCAHARQRVRYIPYCTPGRLCGRGVALRSVWRCERYHALTDKVKINDSV